MALAWHPMRLWRFALASVALLGVAVFWLDPSFPRFSVSSLDFVTLFAVYVGLFFTTAALLALFVTGLTGQEPGSVAVYGLILLGGLLVFFGIDLGEEFLTLHGVNTFAVGGFHALPLDAFMPPKAARRRR